MNDLEEEKYTWFLGTYFFKKYFTVYDNAPAEGGEAYNYVGIGACQSHKDHVEITDDEFGDLKPSGSSSSSTTTKNGDGTPTKYGPNGEGPTDDDGSGASPVLIVFLVLLIIGIFAGGIFYYIRMRRGEQQVTFARTSREESTENE